MNWKLIFAKGCWKVQFDEQIYMALCAIKQEVDEKVEVYYKRILEMKNCL